jgi:prepilin-type N-terminal cleavage/methylation domain-containing protein
VSDEKRLNKGFTLVELIIAIAMLAFLMTAVCSFMSSGIIGYKNAKADIRVHNSAQETYDKLSDAIMEARDIYLFGYLDGEDKLYCFVRDEEQADNITTVESKMGLSDTMGIGSSTAAYFTDIAGKKIQVKALVIDTAVPISEEDFGDMTPTASGAYKNNLYNTGTAVEISKATKTVVTTNPDGSTSETLEDVKSSSGEQIYTVNDTLRQMFVFDDADMYYMTKYAFAQNNNDNYADATGDKDMSDYLYTSSLATVHNSTLDADLTDCVAYVESSTGSMSIDLNFSDRNMTYTTNGMIKTRNSYVMEAKK